MMDFVTAQIAARLGRVASEVRRTLKNPGAGAVHDLRVSIRRFLQSLRIFASLLPKKATKKIRRQLREVLKLAGRLRDYDIALQLLLKCGYPKGGEVSRRLLQEREQGEARLRQRLRRLERQNFSARWRSQLKLGVAA